MKAQSDCVYTDFKYFAYTKGGGGAVPLRPDEPVVCSNCSKVIYYHSKIYFMPLKKSLKLTKAVFDL